MQEATRAPPTPCTTKATRSAASVNALPSLPGSTGSTTASPPASVPDLEMSAATLKPEPSLASPSCPGPSVTSQVRRSGWGGVRRAGSQAPPGGPLAPQPGQGPHRPLLEAWGRTCSWPLVPGADLWPTPAESPC